MARIYPSLISAPLLRLEQVIRDLEPHCDGFHLDVMDNHFVPNLTWGASFMNAVGAISGKPLWIHLMMDNPLAFLSHLTAPAGTIISIHYESGEPISSIVAAITKRKWRASIAISPDTPVEKILNDPTIAQLHQILVMSVQPGFSGQRFLPESIEKVAALAAHRTKHNLSFRIGIDGGINAENLPVLIEQGVDDAAIASAIFAEDDYVKAMEKLLSCQTRFSMI